MFNLKNLFKSEGQKLDEEYIKLKAKQELLLMKIKIKKLREENAKKESLLETSETF
jgi:hypothetical protein